MTSSPSAAASTDFAVWFKSLFHEGRGLMFPCDETGHVDISSLTERGRTNYFLARDMLGREYATPLVIRSAGSRPH
jgi:hypothetical protein